MEMEEETLEQFFEPEPEVQHHANKMEHGDARNRLALQMLKTMRESLTHVIQLLEEGDETKARREMVNLVTSKRTMENEMERVTGTRVIEGVFDGMNMVGSDGVRYDVPTNYASKSRLVEGDMLKLTLKGDGTHLYKQIGPVERKRVVAVLSLNEGTNEYFALHEDSSFKVLSSSVSYFKGVPGDEIIILTPRDGSSVWAAVENIVRS